MGRRRRKPPKSPLTELMLELQPSKSWGGEASVKQGAALENRLMEEASVFLERQHKVDLIFIPPRYKILRGRTKDNCLRCVPDKSTWVDFIAEWAGPSVHFDAKSTTGDSWHIDERLKTYQGEILKRQHARGKVTFVYVRHRKSMGFDDYVIPYTQEGLPFSNKSSIVWSKIEEWKMPRGQCWFDAVLVWDGYLKEGWKASKTKMGNPIKA